MRQIKVKKDGDAFIIERSETITNVTESRTTLDTARNRVEQIDRQIKELQEEKEIMQQVINHGRGKD